MALTLDALGTLLRKVQADARTSRDEVTTLRSEVAALREEATNERATTARLIADMLRATEGRITDRIAELETTVATLADAMGKASD